MNEENKRQARGEEVTAAVQEVAEIRGGEVRRALRRMKSREAVASDENHVLVTVAGRPKLASGFHKHAQW